MVFSVVFFILFFAVFSLVLVLWLTRRPATFSPLSDQPKVSILIAARDEEQNILRCLQAINRLNYPKDKLEVLVGDDRSTDKTRAIVEYFSQSHPYITCIPILVDLPGTKGKANVLAQLAQHATSDYYFITDADIEVPVDWVSQMLSALKPGIGIVTGITTTTGNSLLAKMQTLDWLFTLGLMQVVTDRGGAAFTMGNNMLVTREAYEAVGGYEHIAFSITEDIKLLEEVRKKGYGAANVYAQEVMALSQPAPDFGTLLVQRRRWMRGSTHLPWYMWLLLAIYSSYYPIWLPFFAHASVMATLLIFIAKLILQSLFVGACLREVRMKARWWEFLLLELYLLITYLILIVCFFLPFKIKWKGRSY